MTDSKTESVPPDLDIHKSAKKDSNMPGDNTTSGSSSSSPTPKVSSSVPSGNGSQASSTPTSTSAGAASGGGTTDDPKTFNSMAKRLATKNNPEKYKKPEDFQIMHELTKTYVLKEVLNEGYKTWVTHKFPNVRMAVITKMFIEGNYRPALQLSWDKETMDNARKEAIEEEVKTAEEITIEFGNWQVNLKAEKKEDLDMFGGVKSVIAKSIVIHGFQYAWTKHNGVALFMDILKEYIEFPEDAKIQLIEEDKRFFGSVVFPVKQFKKIPVNEIEVPSIHFNQTENKFVASKTSTFVLKIKTIGADRTKRTEFVRPPMRCRKCQSLKHVISECPRMRHSNKLFYCSQCGHKGTCTILQCEQKKNLQNGVFSNPAPRQTETLVSDPFNHVGKKSKKSAKNQQAPREEANENFPTLQNRPQTEKGFWQPTAEQQKRSEVPGIKANRPKSTTKSTKRSNPDKNKRPGKSRGFNNLIGLKDTDLDLNRDGLAFDNEMVDGYAQAEAGASKITLNQPKESSRGTGEGLQNNVERQQLELPEETKEHKKEDETRTGMNNPEGTSSEGPTHSDSDSELDLEEDDNYSEDNLPPKDPKAENFDAIVTEDKSQSSSPPDPASGIGRSEKPLQSKTDESTTSSSSNSKTEMGAGVSGSSSKVESVSKDSDSASNSDGEGEPAIPKKKKQKKMKKDNKKKEKTNGESKKNSSK